MQVWRLTKLRHTALDGEGARVYGGRWNSAGKAAIYTAASLSLALLEQLVRIDPDEIPDDFVSLRIEIPDDAPTTRINFQEFPPNWRRPESLYWFKERGNAWIDQQETLTMTVPSVIVPEETNIILNPSHAQIRRVKIVETKPFIFDDRLYSL